MPDRTLHSVPPLTAAQKAERFDKSVSIQVTAHAKSWDITREWVRDTLSQDSLYGFVEKYVAVSSEQGVFSLSVEGTLDILAMTRVIVDEIQRQRSEGAT